MLWIKRHSIFLPSASHPFCTTRVMAPTPWRKNPSVIRLFCGFCDSQGISRPGYVDVSADNPVEIRAISQRPLMEVGQDGDFDDNGVCPTSIVELPGGVLRMYYFGFQKLHKVPYSMFSGVAESRDDGETFVRVQRVPVLDRSAQEPLMRSGPFVMLDEGKYKVWYPCGVRWIEVDGKKVHEYNLHYAESADGIIWPGEGHIAVNITPSDEYGLGRPYVIKGRQGYLLFYSVRTRSRGYHIACSYSVDGVSWQPRRDVAGLESSSGWDSEMQCYAAVIAVGNRTYMFYNGNNLGNTGFGYAEIATAELM